MAWCCRRHSRHILPVIWYFPPWLIWKSRSRVCPVSLQPPLLFQRWIWGCRPTLVPVSVGSIRVSVGEGPPTGPGCQDAHHSGQRPQHPPTAGELARGSDHKITAGPQPESGQCWLQGISSPMLLLKYRISNTTLRQCIAAKKRCSVSYYNEKPFSFSHYNKIFVMLLWLILYQLIQFGGQTFR